MAESFQRSESCWTGTRDFVFYFILARFIWSIGERFFVEKGGTGVWEKLLLSFVIEIVFLESFSVAFHVTINIIVIFL